MKLSEYKHFIDEEMIIIMRQMDAPSQIFDYLYLGSEWNASNLDELRNNGFVLLSIIVWTYGYSVFNCDLVWGELSCIDCLLSRHILLPRTSTCEKV